MAKVSNRNFSLVKGLMDAMYRYRRHNILEQPTSVQDVMDTYPALQFVSEVRYSGKFVAV